MSSGAICMLETCTLIFLNRTLPHNSSQAGLKILTETHKWALCALSRRVALGLFNEPSREVTSLASDSKGEAWDMLVQHLMQAWLYRPGLHAQEECGSHTASSLTQTSWAETITMQGNWRVVSL